MAGVSSFEGEEYTRDLGEAKHGLAAPKLSVARGAPK
jgi:hypothetical protein